MIAGLTASDIHAEIVFDSSALEAGIHTVPVVVTIQENGITVLNDDLKAEISIAEKVEKKAEKEEKEETPT